MSGYQVTKGVLLWLCHSLCHSQFYLLVSIGFGLMVSNIAQAQIGNGTFETGDFTQWTIGGNGSVEVLQQNDFAPMIAPSEGTFIALLSSGPGDVAGLFNGDFDQNGTNDFDGSTLSIAFTTTAADQALSFDWAFLTSEAGQAALYDDLFDVTIDGISILNGSTRKPGGVSTFLDTPTYDGLNYLVTSAGPTNASQFLSGLTTFRSFCTNIAQPGTYTLQFLIADQGDAVFDSGLLIDNVQSPSTCERLVQVTNSAGSTTIAQNGGFIVSLLDNQKPAASLDASILAFVSTANYTNANPEARPQVFVAAGNTMEQLTTAGAGTVANPSVTLNGRFVAFEATSDLAPGSPGNADGNREIFRLDRTTSTLTQITNTSLCENTTPSIAHDIQGQFIAFATTCTALVAGFNSDGNHEVILWDESSNNYDRFETIGCATYQPVLGRDNNGRWVTFLSTCDLTGNNGDGNAEVVQWDRQGNSFQQITMSVGHNNDAVSASLDGTFISFVSNADYAGSNADGNIEVFRFDRANNTIEQLTQTTIPELHLSTNIDSTGRFIALERLDSLASVSETRSSAALLAP